MLSLSIIDSKFEQNSNVCVFIDVIEGGIDIVFRLLPKKAHSPMFNKLLGKLIVSKPHSTKAPFSMDNTPSGIAIFFKL
jgi:hypothetical protein